MLDRTVNTIRRAFYMHGDNRMSEGGLVIVGGREAMVQMVRRLISSARHDVRVDGLELQDESWVGALIEGLQERAAKWAATGQEPPACSLRVLRPALQKPQFGEVGLAAPAWPQGVQLTSRAIAASEQILGLRAPMVIVDNDRALVAAHDAVVPASGEAGYLVSGPAASRLSIKFAQRWNVARRLDDLSSDISVERTNPRWGRGIEDAQRSIRLFVAGRVVPATAQPRFGSTRYFSEAFC